MLDNFAPEIPGARIERQPVELVGFASEMSFSPAPSVSVRLKRDSGSVPSPVALVQAGSVCAVLTIAVAAIPGRAASTEAPPLPEIQHSRVFVAVTPVRFSIAPARRNQTPLPVTSDRTSVPKREPAPKPVARTNRPSPAKPFVVARALERATQKPQAWQPRDQASIPAAAPGPIAARAIVSPSAAAPSLAAVAVPSVSDEALVRSMLERYRGAYERLDASAARQVWPSLDERRLARAFSTLKSQTLDFEDCSIDVGSARGVAHCRGRATYVGRVGKREPETQNRRWTFQIRKTGDSWAIDSVRSE